MDPDIIEPIMAVVGMLSIGSLVLIGMKMRYQHKAKMLEPPKGGEEMERLADAMDSIYEQSRALREDFSELQDRLDFHERLLTRPKEDDGSAEGR